MDVKQKIPLLLSLFLSACASPERPSVDVEIYFGDSKTKSIVRNIWGGNSKSISASSVMFDDYIALHGKDFAKFIKAYVFGCEKWKARFDSDLTEQEQSLLDDLTKRED